MAETDTAADESSDDAGVPLPTLTVMILPDGTAFAQVATGDTVSMESEVPRSHLSKLVDLGTDELEESWEIIMRQLQDAQAAEQNGTGEAVGADVDDEGEPTGNLGPAEAEPVED